LHSANDTTQRDEAWAEFVAAHSDTVLRACRAMARDRDAAMDGYAYTLAALSQAQRETLRNSATAGPFYWAGFVLVGGR